MLHLHVLMKNKTFIYNPVFAILLLLYVLYPVSLSTVNIVKRRYSATKAFKIFGLSYIFKFIFIRQTGTLNEDNKVKRTYLMEIILNKIDPCRIIFWI